MPSTSLPLGPLSGYRIIDLTTMISGPMATGLLGDQGADVIKVEAPGVGDLVRLLGRPREGITATFATTNRNKRSIVLDLKQADDLEAFHKLVATADVVYETSDGWMTAGAVSDSEWQGLARALEHPEWLDDERFKTAGGRVAYAKERLDQTADVLKTRTTEEWLEKLDAEQVPCAPILPLRDVIRHPQIVENDLIVESDHPVAGRIRQPRAAARFDKTPTTLARPAPTHGQHTDEILKELGIERA